MRLDYPAAHVDRFRAIVARRLGLSFDEQRRPALEEIFCRRVDAKQLDPEVYLSRLDADGSGRFDAAALSRDLTVTETYFFRNRGQLEAFSGVALPARRRARSPERRLHIVSAGCASGEEPYSLAMLVRDTLPDFSSLDVSIRAIDLNPTMLARAAEARFSEWALRETGADLRARYFRADGKNFVLDPSVVEMVAFEEANLVDPSSWLAAPGTLDVVFCRNVIMYFTRAAARAVIDKISRALAPGGFLFLGEAETLRGLSNDFHLRHTHGTFYYERRSAEDRGDRIISEDRPSARDEYAPPLAPGQSWVVAIENATRKIEALTGPSPQPVGAAELESSENDGSAPVFDVASVVELLRGERFTEARNLLEGVPKSRADVDPDILLLKAVAFAQGADSGSAEMVCARLLEIDELNSGAHYVLALCRESAGDVPGASERYRMASYLDPTFAMPRLHLGLLLRRNGNHGAARLEFTAAELLLQREDSARILLFGGGFSRVALIRLCQSELELLGALP